MVEAGSGPLVLTLQMDPESFVLFNDLRKRYFPVSRNLVPAHISLFHQLPSSGFEEIDRFLEKTCSRTAAMTLSVTGLHHLGRGVAFTMDSSDLHNLRSELEREWKSWLTAQDTQSFRPHITVQNKVSPQDAQLLFAQLESQFSPFNIAGIGLDLWEYLDGPWRLRKTYRFESVRRDAPEGLKQ